MNLPADHWLQQSASSVCQASIEAALDHQAQLTKPPGSLGNLEQLAVQLAGLQASVHPQIKRVAISIFAADHGIAQAGVSAFPQAVTGQMIANFASGGAAIAVIAREIGASLRITNLGTAEPLPPIDGVENLQIMPGTLDFSESQAMTEAQLAQALDCGRQHIEQLAATGELSGSLFIGGEMGIGNTTSASAIAALLLALPATDLVGAGTGVNQQVQALKAQLIEQARTHHALTPQQPLRILQCVGGLEIAALTGAYIRAAQLGIPALVDGFITTAAALVAVHINPSIRPWLLFGHTSAERGHSLLLQALQAQPIVQMQLRLGEASGAACAVPLLKLACSLHNQMATFASAGVSQEQTL